jgi:hypothetical protein
MSEHSSRMKLYIDSRYLEARAGICPTTGQYCDILRGKTVSDPSLELALDLVLSEVSVDTMTAEEIDIVYDTVQTNRVDNELVLSALAGVCTTVCVLDPINRQ